MYPLVRSSFLMVLLFSAVSLAACQSNTRDVRAGTLVSVAGMSEARAAHTATALPDGCVLVVGGFGEGGKVAGAELYDPAANAFIPVGSMATPRYSHTATLLADGRVLIAGGYNAQGDYLSSAELYDPITNSFTPVASLNSARADQVAVSLEDGQVLFIGGVGPGWTFLASAELYDPTTDTFARVGSMAVPRESHTAVRLNDSRVLVAGGHQGRRDAIELYASAELYDPVTESFTPTGDMSVRRHKHDAVLLPDGHVLITGGADERDSGGVYQSTELYDAATHRFTSAGMMRLARYKHRGTSAVLPDGRVLLAGGATQAEVYDPRTGIFNLVSGNARMAGQFSASALLPA